MGSFGVAEVGDIDRRRRGRLGRGDGRFRDFYLVFIFLFLFVCFETRRSMQETGRRRRIAADIQGKGRGRGKGRDTVHSLMWRRSTRGAVFAWKIDVSEKRRLIQLCCAGLIQSAFLGQSKRRKRGLQRRASVYISSRRIPNERKENRERRSPGSEKTAKQTTNRLPLRREGRVGLGKDAGFRQGRCCAQQRA